MCSEAKAAAVVTIRRAQPEDARTCGEICYGAFEKINGEHGFPPELPSPDIAINLLSRMFSHSGYFCVVAEVEGRVVGSNCLDQREAIAGIGPITVDPGMQNGGVGRKLMDAVLVACRSEFVSTCWIVCSAET
jgi:predicted N-acetyltransferase YhbS